MSASEGTPNASSAVKANADPLNGGSPLTPIQFQQQWLADMVGSVEDAGGLADQDPVAVQGGTPATKAHSGRAGQQQSKSGWKRFTPKIPSRKGSMKKDTGLHLDDGVPVIIRKLERTSKIGITLDGWTGPPKIVSIAPDGIAAAAKLSVGQYVLAIDGKPVNGHEACTDMLRKAIGEITLLVAPPAGNHSYLRPPAPPAFDDSRLSMGAPIRPGEWDDAPAPSPRSPRSKNSSTDKDLRLSGGQMGLSGKLIDKDSVVTPDRDVPIKGLSPGSGKMRSDRIRAGVHGARRGPAEKSKLSISELAKQAIAQASVEQFSGSPGTAPVQEKEGVQEKEAASSAPCTSATSGACTSAASILITRRTRIVTGARASSSLRRQAPTTTEPTTEPTTEAAPPALPTPLCHRAGLGPDGSPG